MINWLIKARYTADYKNLEPIRKLVDKEADAVGVSKDHIYDLMLAVTELITNAIEHGYHGEEGWVQIEIGLNKSDLIIVLSDGAPHYDPTTTPIPDIDVPLEHRPMRGLGVYIVRETMDEFTYKLDDEGNNQVTIIKHNITGDVKEDADGNNR
ncbi:MAG: ATP-binding protein [Anaerolineales bacterium]